MQWVDIVVADDLAKEGAMYRQVSNIRRTLQDN